MNQINFWEQFEKTGKVMDYLNFAACTKEEEKEENKEGECHGNTTNHNRDGINSDAYW